MTAPTTQEGREARSDAPIGLAIVGGNLSRLPEVMNREKEEQEK